MTIADTPNVLALVLELNCPEYEPEEEPKSAADQLPESAAEQSPAGISYVPDMAVPSLTD